MFKTLIKAILPERVGTKITVASIYARHFGVTKGLIAFCKLSTKKDRTVKISIPQSRSKILLRANTSDIQTFEQIFISQSYELGIDITPRLIVDGGANVGYASIYFANKYPDAQVIALEPEESNFELLKKNTAAYPNVMIFRSGIWNKRVPLKIENPTDQKWAFRLREADAKDEGIDAMTIEKVMEVSGSNVIDILKLDIEGAEVEVFSDCQNWIDKVGVLIVELHDRSRPGCSHAFYSAISGLNFRESQRGDNVILISETLKARSASPLRTATPNSWFSIGAIVFMKGLLARR